MVIPRVFFLLLIFASCSRPEEFKIPYDGDKIVLNGVLCPQQEINVQITKSYAPNNNAPEDISVPNATVMLFENEVYIENLIHSNQGFYNSSSQFKPVENNTYKLFIEAAGLPAAESGNTLVPTRFPFVSLYVRSIQSDLNPQKDAVQLEITLADSAATEDYYLIKILGFLKGDTQAYQPTVWVPGDNGDIDIPCIFYEDKIIYKDKCFNGEIYKAFIGVEASVFTSQFVDKKLASLEIRMQKIPEEYFLYLESSRLIEGVALAFFEPPYLKTNIRNGFGILTSCNERIVYVDMP